MTRASGALRAHSVLIPRSREAAQFSIRRSDNTSWRILPPPVLACRCHLFFIAEDRPIWPPDALIASSGHSRTMRPWRAAQQYSLVDVGLPGAGVDVTQLRSLFLRISCDVIVGLRWIQPEQASGSAPALSVGNRRCRHNRHHGDRTENDCKKAGAFHLVEFQHGDVSLSRLMRRFKGSSQGDRSAYEDPGLIRIPYRNAILLNMTGQLKVSTGMNITFTSTAS